MSLDGQLNLAVFAALKNIIFGHCINIVLTVC